VHLARKVIQLALQVSPHILDRPIVNHGREGLQHDVHNLFGAECAEILVKVVRKQGLEMTCQGGAPVL